MLNNRPWTVRATDRIPTNTNGFIPVLKRDEDENTWAALCLLANSR